MPHLPEEDRWQIIQAWKMHGSIPAVARALRRATTVVRRWVKRYVETGGVQLGTSTGRRPALGGVAASRALELLQQGDGAAGVATQLVTLGLASTKVHKTTLIRAARREALARGAQLKAVRGKPAKQLTTNTKQKRLAFAAANKSRTWGHVMFTDRKKFHFSYPGAKVRPVAWVIKGTKQQAYTVNHPQVVNVYAGLTKHGMTKAHVVAGTSKHKTEHTNAKGAQARNITSSEYAEVLKKTLLPEATRLFSTKGAAVFVLQQDNDPTHRVAEATLKEWNAQHSSGHQLLAPWPPNSPDLNPIENVWAWVQNRVNAMGCSSFEQFKQAVLDGIKAVPKEMIKKLFDSMPKRLAQVTESGGDKTKY
jgi:hypothetical protein